MVTGPRVTTGVLLAATWLLASCVSRQGDNMTERRTVPDTPSEPPIRLVLPLPTFDDALATIVTGLEAAPGQSAVHRWTAATEGSVRLVGHVRKAAGDATATFRVLADGVAVWSRELRSADLIPHAFDIVAYDLTAGSAIDLVVTAEGDSSPATAEVGLQVVPEPFVSRWQADLATGYPEFSGTAREALRRKGQGILQAIRDASASGLSRIVIPPGDYLFHAHWSHASTLRDLADLEIVAEDVTFWFEPPMVHALLFENCRNVTVRGLTIDFTLPCWFQACVTDIDREQQAIRATLMPGYEPRNAKGEAETEGGRTFMFYDAQGRFINHRHTPGKWELSGDGSSVLCREFTRNQPPAALQPGGYIVGAIRTGAALRSVRCANMRFEDVNIWSSPGIAVNENGGAGGHVYRRVRATRRPHTNRLQAFGADVFHLAGTDRGPTLDRCESAYSADDNLNIHGSFGRVVERVGDRRYYLQGAYEVGDSLEFRDMRSVALLGTAKVVSAEETPDGPEHAINEKYKATGEFLVRLDQPLELPPLALVVLDGKRSAAGWSLRNCWLHDNFQRTLINGSPGGLIENTTLRNVGMGVCVQFETWGPWMEGPFARDLVIRNNRFLDAPPDAAAINVSMHPPRGGSNRRRFDARPVTNMTITGNYFGRATSPPLSIHNVDGLTIRGNSIDQPPRAPRPVGLNNSSTHNWLYLQDCVNVAIRENLLDNRKATP